MGALKAAGCERTYREASGGRWGRPELHRLLDQIREGDVLVVWKLDRLSHSLRDVLTILERAMLRERTKAGLDSARREGRIGGRPPKLTLQQQSEIKKMVSKGHKMAADVARLFKVHPATISRLLARVYAK
jgi:DNA invertase Pin-like site-specific DNA recombinase